MREFLVVMVLVAAACTSLQGPKGDTGKQGPKGDTGAPGPVGATGAQGPQGLAGIDARSPAAADVYVVNTEVAFDADAGSAVAAADTAAYCEPGDILIGALCSPIVAPGISVAVSHWVTGDGGAQGHDCAWSYDRLSPPPGVGHDSIRCLRARDAGR